MSFARRSARNRAADNYRLRIALQRFATEDLPPAPVDAIKAKITEGEGVPLAGRDVFTVAAVESLKGRAE